MRFHLKAEQQKGERPSTLDNESFGYVLMQ